MPTPSSAAPAVNKDRPLTSGQLLKANAAAPDPKLAALEQAVNDRNVLSAQNAQLWKLIEKQRAGYNQILKELERVRGERDTFKAKLGGSGSTSSSGHGDRRYKSNEGDKPAKRSFSENVHDSNGDNGLLNGNPRQTLERHYSDDQGMFFILGECVLGSKMTSSSYTSISPPSISTFFTLSRTSFSPRP